MTRLGHLTMAAAVCMALLPLCGSATKADDTADLHMRAVFQAKYQEWMKIRDRVTRASGPSSKLDLGAIFNNDAVRAIVALGPGAIPCIMDALPGDHFLGYCLFLISKWRYHKVRIEQNGVSTWTVEEYPDIRQSRVPDAVMIWQRWWREGQKGVDDRFAGLKTKWALLTTAEKMALWTTETFYSKQDRAVQVQRTDVTEAGKVYLAVQDLGIAVLPELVPDLKQGHYEFLDIALTLTGEQAVLPDLGLSTTERAHAFLVWWEANKEKWTIPWPTKN